MAKEKKVVSEDKESQKTLMDNQMSSGKTKAHEMATKQRDISVAEFFEKNRHLLGFDNKRKALLTAIKEAVDNSLDACEEAEILPEINIQIIEMGAERYRVIVEDNGPGIVKKQVPNIFARLLYGSKFHRLKQSRGQQGIGISAAALYGQLTTGRPIRILSKIHKNEQAYYCELHLDTTTNRPVVLRDEARDWAVKETGTKLELDLEGIYQKGGQSVDEFIKQTAIVNPHATIIYTTPKAEQFIFARSTDEKPILPKEIKPHPYGVEIGMLMKMLTNTESRTVQQFLTSEFSRVSPAVAKEICEQASILPSMKPEEVNRELAEKMMQGIKNTKIIAPPTDCLSPIGAELIKKSLRKEIKAEFYESISRSPSVYRGNPFVIEVGIAYGGELPGDQQIKVMRFVNRVPLLYQPGACGITEAVTTTNWKAYGIQQSGSNMPVGPVIITVHFASVWAPFTSEAKEALAHYPEILAEIKLALQEGGRNLGRYVAKKKRVSLQQERASLFDKYIPEAAASIAELAGDKKDRIEKLLTEMKKKPDILPVADIPDDDDIPDMGTDEETEESNEEAEEKSKTNKKTETK